MDRLVGVVGTLRAHGGADRHVGLVLSSSTGPGTGLQGHVGLVIEGWGRGRLVRPGEVRVEGGAGDVLLRLNVVTLRGRLPGLHKHRPAGLGVPGGRPVGVSAVGRVHLVRGLAVLRVGRGGAV